MWLQCETVAICFHVLFHSAELLHCQWLLTDRCESHGFREPFLSCRALAVTGHARAGCCQPERRSCTFANWDRPDTTGCFAPCLTLTGYPQALTGGSEPDRRSRALANWNRRMWPLCPIHAALCGLLRTDRRRGLSRDRSFELRCRRGRCCTVTDCRHQKIVKVPYSNPAASSRQVTDWPTH